MLELLGTIFGSIFSGGATGIIGVALQRFADFKNKQIDMQLEAQRAQNELDKRKLDLEIIGKEWAGRVQVAVTEGESAKDVAASRAFEASLFKEPERYSSTQGLTWGQQWVLVVLDAVRGSVRPLLTVYLCALTTYVWYQVRQVLGQQNLDAAAAMQVWHLVVGQILYLTSTCVLWFFGTRNKASAPVIR